MKLLNQTYNKIPTGIIELPDGSGYIIDGVYYNQNFITKEINKNILYDRDPNLFDYRTSFGMKGVISNNFNYYHCMNYLTSVMNPNKLQNCGMWIEHNGEYVFTTTKPDDNIYTVSNGLMLSKNYSQNNNIFLFYKDKDSNIPYSIFYSRGNGNLYIFRKHDFWESNTFNSHALNISNSYYTSQILNDRNGIIYSYLSNNGNFYLGRFNKLSNTYSNILTANDSRFTGALTGALETDIENTDTNTYYITYNNSGNLVIQQWILNYNNQTVSVNNTTLDINTTFNHNPTANIRYYPFLHRLNNDTYLTIITTNIWADPSNTNGNNIYKIITYKIDNNDSTKLYKVFEYTFPTDVILGFDLISSDNNIIAIASLSGLYISYFDGNNWDLSNFIISSSTLRTYIRDSKDRIFIVNDDKSIDMYSINIPYNVKLKFEKDTYQYTGTIINTYVDIEVLNHLGQRISVNGDLIIKSNNAIFDDGSKIKSITTSTNGAVRQPLKITNAGMIDILFNIKI